MDHTSVEKALQVSPKVDGKFSWTSDNVVSFKPSSGWDRAKRYTVNLTDTAKSAKGLELARPETFNVSTVGYLDVAQTIPAADAQDVSADSRITILFNRPVVSLTLIGQQANLPNPVKFDPLAFVRLVGRDQPGDAGHAGPRCPIFGPRSGRHHFGHEFVTHNHPFRQVERIPCGAAASL